MHDTTKHALVNSKGNLTVPKNTHKLLEYFIWVYLEFYQKLMQILRSCASDEAF